MKQINIWFEDEDFYALRSKKISQDITWKELILQLK